MSGLMKRRRAALTRLTSGLLASLLAFGFGGAGRGAFAGNSSAQTPAVLSVSSDPTGADVYVDGELRGTTPLTLGDLAPGEHRVKVTKEGYLENARLVSIEGGQTAVVEVKLTPYTAQEPEQEPQGETGATTTEGTTTTESAVTEGRKSSKKKILIGAGILAAGTTIVAAAAGGEPENVAPRAGTINVSPTGIGLAAVTVFTFTAQGATDANGDALTYSWNLGDGTTGAGESVTHTYAKAGSFQVTLTVSDGTLSGTANAAKAVTVKDVTGTWINTKGAVGIPEGIIRKLVITQTGTTFTGTYTISTLPRVKGTVNGTVSAPRNVSFSAPLLDFPFNFTGTIDEQVVKWDGRGNGSGLHNVSMVFGREP